MCIPCDDMGESHEHAVPLHDLRKPGPSERQPGVRAFLHCVAAAAADGPLPAALRWIKQHAQCGSTPSLPDDLARAVCFSTQPGVDSTPPSGVPDTGPQAKRRRLGDTLFTELPAHMAGLPFAPPPRPRLSALEPTAGAAALHALRLNVRRPPVALSIVRSATPDTPRSRRVARRRCSHAPRCRPWRGLC